VTAAVLVKSPFVTAPAPTVIDTVFELVRPERATRIAEPTIVEDETVAFVAVIIAELDIANVPVVVTGKSM
jgi:hypothetical protein